MKLFDSCLNGPYLLLVISLAACAGEPPEPTLETLSPAVAAQPRGSDAEMIRRVEDYLEPWIERGDFRGVVRIARGGEVLVHTTQGLEDRVAGDARDAPFRIASLTKTITAGAILMLRDDGSLSLDDRLEDFVPGVGSGEQITIEHLLAHAGGVAPPDEALYFRDSPPLEELVANIAAKPLIFDPGSEHRYSNAGYNLLARVIEVASGRGYEEHLQATIFEPLDMGKTGHFETSPQTVVAGLRPGPGPSGVRPAPLIHFAAATGSGSLASTAADLHRWGLTVAREELFSYEGLMWPFGWGKLDAGGEQGLEQTGAMTGVTSSLAIFPESETVVVVLNAVEASAWTRWSRDLAAIAFGDEIAPPEIAMPIDREIDFENLVGLYRDGETTIRAAQGDGLELFWNTWPHGRYLTPLADGSFLSRTSGGQIRFEPESEPAQRLIARWGDQEQVFVRAEDRP